MNYLISIRIRIISCLIILNTVFGLPTWAEDKPENKIKSGFNYARKICQSYRDSQLKKDCENITNEAKFLDVNGVNLCEYQFDISAQTLTCLANISGKIYSNQELEKCLNTDNEYQTYQCLSQAGKLFDETTIATTTETTPTTTRERRPPPPERNPENNQTQPICDSMDKVENRQKCERIIAQSFFIDLSAINLCENNISSSERILKCLESINDKIYVPTEINQCQQIKDENELINCLSVSGESMDSFDFDNILGVANQEHKTDIPHF